jgi:hypothetical protein
MPYIQIGWGPRLARFIRLCVTRGGNGTAIMHQIARLRLLSSPDFAVAAKHDR